MHALVHGLGGDIGLGCVWDVSLERVAQDHVALQQVPTLDSDALRGHDHIQGAWDIPAAPSHGGVRVGAVNGSSKPFCVEGTERGVGTENLFAPSLYLYTSDWSLRAPSCATRRLVHTRTVQERALRLERGLQRGHRGSHIFTIQLSQP